MIRDIGQPAEDEHQEAEPHEDAIEVARAGVVPMLPAGEDQQPSEDEGEADVAEPLTSSSLDKLLKIVKMKNGV